MRRLAVLAVVLALPMLAASMWRPGVRPPGTSPGGVVVGGGGGGGAPSTTVTAAFTATKMQGTTCVAPCAVHFDAVATSDTDYTRPFHTHKFVWDFDDAGGGSWAVGANTLDKNADIGPIVGHVYATAGTYDPIVTVTAPDGDTDTYTTTITVADIDSTFAGSATVCIGASSDPTPPQTGCPSGSSHINGSGDLDAALASCGATSGKKRCLFEGGGTFTASTGITLSGAAGPGVIGAWGTGAPTFEGYASSNTLSLATGWTLMGVTVHNNNTGATSPLILAANAANVTVVNNSITNLYYFALDHSANTSFNNLIAFVNNSTSENSAATSAGPGVIMQTENSVVMGNTIDSNNAGQFSVRTVHARNTVFSHNSIIDIVSGHTALQMRSWGGASPPANTDNQWVVISQNKFGSRAVDVAGFIRLCQTNTCDNTAATAVDLVDYLIEQNFAYYESGGSPTGQYGLVYGQGGRITIRNNVFDFQGFVSTGGTSRLIMAHEGNSTLGAGASLIDDEWMAYNNTVYTDDSGTRTLVVCDSLSNGTGHYCVGNLLDARNETGTRGTNGTSGTGFTSTANNVVSPGSNSFTSTPGAQGATTAASFTIPASGPAYQTGFDFAGLTTLWGLYDFGGTEQSAPWDAGAWSAP